MNKKISTSLFKLRFNEKLLCFDIKKAFLMIKLAPSDQSKLLFYWYKNVSKGDFSLIVYKHCRLPFGLPCSPTLLMLALYKLLILDVEDDSIDIKDFKREIYDLAYMDNLACSGNDSEKLRWGYSKLKNIFDPYHFGLQQFIANDDCLQKCIDQGKEETPSRVNLLGLIWDRSSDTLLTNKILLDSSATTKRTISSSIAANFDVFSFYGPLLNRARLFMHSLQCKKEISWDDKLSDSHLREWKNIYRQINNIPEISINRFALERYRNVSQKFTEKKDKKQRVDAQTTTSLASAVNSKSSRANFKKCTLCLADDIKNIDHPIFKCTVYATPQSKMDKLQSLNFCTKLRIVDSISEINANIAVSGILSIFASLLIRLIIPVNLKCVAKVKMVMLQRNRNKFLWGLA